MNFKQIVLFVWLLIAFFTFTVFFKIENQSSSTINWPLIFFPLFNLDAAFALYVVTKMVKEYREQGHRISRTMCRYWLNLLMVSLYFTFKLLASLRIQSIISLSYTVVFLPLFALLAIINVASFRLMFRF